MRVLLTATIAALATFAAPPAHGVINSCVTEACDQIGVLRDQVASGVVGLPGGHGLVNHLAVAQRKCVQGKLAPVIAQLGAFRGQVQGLAPQHIPQTAADEVSAYVQAIADSLGDVAAGGRCIKQLGLAQLRAECPVAGSTVPLADNFDDGVMNPNLWFGGVGPDTEASLAEADGVLQLHNGPADQGDEGNSPYGYLSRCEYPSQDFTATADVTIAADAKGEYAVQLHVDGAVIRIGHETQGGHGFVAILFKDIPVPDVAEVFLGDLRDRNLRLTLRRETIAGFQWVSGSVVDTTTLESIFSASIDRPIASVAPNRAMILAAFQAGDEALSSDTDAEMTVDNYQTTLVGPLASFFGSNTPLSLDGIAYDSAGTHYLVGTHLTVIAAGGVVAGADGSADLHAALVHDGPQRITFYTDLDQAAFAIYLAFERPGATLDAFVRQVFLADGPDHDYLFDASALTRP